MDGVDPYLDLGCESGSEELRTCELQEFEVPNPRGDGDADGIETFLGVGEISTATVSRESHSARAWRFADLSPGGPSPS